MALMPVDEALARVLSAARKTETVRLSLRDADGYTLAEDVSATRTQPPFAASAMDGYAVRHEELALSRPLHVVGEAAAGHGFSGSFGPGQAVRIFTGAPMPDGADTVLIQEDATLNDSTIVPNEIPCKGLYVRPAGMDFKEGETLLRAGTRINFQSLSLAAAMNHRDLPVHRRPKIGILSNGDELVLPGNKPGEDQIIASNAFGVFSLVRETGGEPVDLGIARDRTEDIVSAFDGALNARCDVLVTLGGASVGDHDLIKPAISAKGAKLDFWKIAMRPGKPFMFGTLDGMLLLGMPGNPVSSLVCSILFLKPLLIAMQGRDPAYALDRARLGNAIGKNSLRQAYLRAHVESTTAGLVATVFDQQDSSVLSVLAAANALVIRPPHAPAADAGDTCEILWL
ncbi:MAG: gephyrin-like molybdotransferase Glp [Pseudomonadota bacterium]